MTSLFNHAVLLASDIPGVGRGIPGISGQYIPTLSADLTWKWFERVYSGSIQLLLVLLTIALLIALFSMSAKQKVTAISVFRCTFIMMILLVGYLKLFGLVMGTTHAFALWVVDEGQIEEYQANWEQAADAAELENLTPEQIEKLPWYARIAHAANVLTPANVAITDLVALASAIGFFLVTTLMNMLWRVLVCILFAFGPLCIVFGVIPQWGSKVTMSWVGAVVQIGLWETWSAGIAMIVNNAEKFFIAASPVNAAIGALEGNPVAVPNRYEAVVIMLICIFLQIAGPLFIGLLFPHSKFATFASWSIIDQTKGAVRMTTNAAKFAASRGGSRG